MNTAKNNQPPSLSKKIERKSNFELLRIIAMLFIVFHHFAVHGGFNFENEISINHFWYYFISTGGKLGVDLFVLISGYFLIEKNAPVFNLNRTLKLEGQVLFYSLSSFALLTLVNKKVSVKLLIKSMFPVIFSKWWFVTAYMVLFLVHPFLNILFKTLSKSAYKAIIIILVCIWSIIPSFTGAKFEGNSVSWFITLYAIAGYLRLYGFNPKIKRNLCFALSALFFFSAFFSTVAFTVMGTKFSFLLSRTTYLLSQNRLPIFLASLFLFIAFSKINMKYSRFINLIASSTFGIYLIHDSGFFKKVVWGTVFNNSSYQNSNLLIPYSIIACILVFVCCSIIDLIRIYTIEKLYLIFINKFSVRIVSPITRLINFTSNLIFGKE